MEINSLQETNLEDQQVHFFIRRFKKTVKNKQKPGRPKTFSECEERLFERQIHNQRTSAVKLTLKCKSKKLKYVNPETVGKYTKYRGRPIRRKSCISKANRKAIL
ncbi:HTH_Tnp_Tc3_2 domain-containing protein [Caerostris darwini]|uniref:HTH_Tnp_Tc3_2 domain-containing protein n=1 Tax=Caerostris darwini TaxID=1538125 RepID=A0AAV4WE19_9ARAC|nr:HTH_Tnp_Tc3_2 domain-containing protein [Caerostris darwini]